MSTVEDKKKKEKTSSTRNPETLDKLSNHTKSLVEDLTSWFELKIQYIILDYQEQLTRKAKSYVIEGVALLVFGIASLFGLVALALWLSDLLGHSAWGFLIVAVMLSVIAVAARLIARKYSSSGEKTEETSTYGVAKEKPKLPGPSLPESSISRNGKD